MSRPESYIVPKNDLSSALGARVLGYEVPSVAPLADKIFARLSQLIAAKATDSENGAVLDSMIDSWRRDAQAELADQHEDRQRHAKDLVIRATALQLQARDLLAQAEREAKEIRSRHNKTLTEIEDIQGAKGSHRV